MDKKEMRRHYLELRRNQAEEALYEAGRRISDRVLSLSQIEESRTIMTYVSFRGEPDTHELIRQLHKAGKNVCVPLCDTEDAVMRAYQIESMDSLVPGAYGILEPKPESPVMPEEIDCVLVPGSVFGRNFHRIGYGKGYYDRFLPQAARAVRIGLCYEACLVERVEPDLFDVPVDLIVTEKEVLAKDEYPVF